MTAQPTPSTVADALNWATESLRRVGVGNPRAESEWMLGAVMNTGRSGVYLSAGRRLTTLERRRLYRLIRERQTRRPLQQVLGQTEFYSLPLHVTSAVLVPRPETEILVDSLVARLRSWTDPRVLDLGTGSGAIGVALAHVMPSCRVVASDISQEALRVARVNARRNDVGGCVSFVRGDLFAPFLAHARFSAIAANPPYIPSSAITYLQPEVRDFEPRDALDGGPDGLRYLRRIVARAALYLAPLGWLALEVGDGQSRSVTSLLCESRGFLDPVVEKDLTGVERVVLAQSRGIST